ncbi:MAG: Fic family protein [Aestuariivirga sp.]
MIYQIPALQPIDQEVLEMIEKQRQQLRFLVGQNTVRWTGSLRRNTFARAVQGSNSIEGYNANLADAVEIIDDEKPENVAEETVRALVGYRNAMTYILRIHDDPHAEINEQFIRSLHFMMLSYDMTRLPGQWRPGPVYVVREGSGEKVYEGPDFEKVPDLVSELVQQMKEAGSVDPMVRGAIVHLNLTMVHPFKDGNGRMARALQTLLLTKGGVVSPIFCSIEEWLGRNTQAYYEILASTGKGRWSPNNDALPWVRFCLHAHYQQAFTLIRRNNEIGRIWEQVSKIIKGGRLPERVEVPLIDAALGYRIRNNRYRSEFKISDVVASRDLKRLCDLEFLLPVGEKRGRYYVAADKLKQIRIASREAKRFESPYEIAGAKDINPMQTQLPFPGMA